MPSTAGARVDDGGGDDGDSVCSRVSSTCIARSARWRRGARCCDVVMFPVGGVDPPLDMVDAAVVDALQTARAHRNRTRIKAAMATPLTERLLSLVLVPMALVVGMSGELGTVLEECVELGFEPVGPAELLAAHEASGLLWSEDIICSVTLFDFNCGVVKKRSDAFEVIWMTATYCGATKSGSTGSAQSSMYVKIETATSQKGKKDGNAQTVADIESMGWNRQR